MYARVSGTTMDSGKKCCVEDRPISETGVYAENLFAGRSGVSASNWKSEMRIRLVIATETNTQHARHCKEHLEVFEPQQQLQMMSLGEPGKQQILTHPPWSGFGWLLSITAITNEKSIFFSERRGRCNEGDEPDGQERWDGAVRAAAQEEMGDGRGANQIKEEDGCTITDRGLRHGDGDERLQVGDLAGPRGPRRPRLHHRQWI